MKIFIHIVLTIFVLFSFSFKASAADAVIEDVRVEHGDNISLAFKVEGAFTEDITQAINSGIPTSFTYIVKLYKVRSLFLDDHIQTIKFNHTVKFDNLKKEYTITMNRKGFGLDDIIVKTEDFEEMKILMSSPEELIFFPKVSFKNGYSYRLGIKAELDVLNLPLAIILDYMLFFVKLWDFETSWYEYTFTY